MKVAWKTKGKYLIFKITFCFIGLVILKSEFDMRLLLDGTMPRYAVFSIKCKVNVVCGAVLTHGM